MKTKIPNYFKLTKTFLIVTLCLALSLPPGGLSWAQTAQSGCPQGKSLDSQRLSHYRQVIRGYLQEVVQLCNNPHPAVREYVATIVNSMLPQGWVDNDPAKEADTPIGRLYEQIAKAGKDFLGKGVISLIAKSTGNLAFGGSQDELGIVEKNLSFQENVSGNLVLRRLTSLWQAQKLAETPYPLLRNETTGAYQRDPAAKAACDAYLSALKTWYEDLVVAFQQYINDLAADYQKNLVCQPGQKAQAELFETAKKAARDAYNLTRLVTPYYANYYRDRYERDTKLYACYSAYYDKLFEAHLRNFSSLPYSNNWYFDPGFYRILDIHRTSWQSYDCVRWPTDKVYPGFPSNYWYPESSVPLPGQDRQHYFSNYFLKGIGLCFSTKTAIPIQMAVRYFKDYLQTPVYDVEAVLNDLNKDKTAEKITPEWVVFTQGFRKYLAGYNNFQAEAKTLYEELLQGLNKVEESYQGFPSCLVSSLILETDDPTKPAAKSILALPFSATYPGEMPADERYYTPNKNLKRYILFSQALSSKRPEVLASAETKKEIKIPEKITLTASKIVKDDDTAKLNLRWVITAIPETPNAKSKDYVLYQKLSSSEIAQFQPDLAGVWTLTLEADDGYSPLLGITPTDPGAIPISVNAIRHILWVQHSNGPYDPTTGLGISLELYQPIKGVTKPLDTEWGGPYYLEVAHEKAGVFLNYNDDGMPVDEDSFRNTKGEYFTLRKAFLEPFAAYDGNYGSDDFCIPQAKGLGGFTLASASKKEEMTLMEVNLTEPQITDLVLSSETCLFGQHLGKRGNGAYFIQQGVDHKAWLNLDGKGFQEIDLIKAGINLPEDSLSIYPYPHFLNVPDWMEKRAAETLNAFPEVLPYVLRIGANRNSYLAGRFTKGTKYICLNPNNRSIRCNLRGYVGYGFIAKANFDSTARHEAHHAFWYWVVVQKTLGIDLDKDNDWLPYIGPDSPPVVKALAGMFDYAFDSPENKYGKFGPLAVKFIGGNSSCPTEYLYIGDVRYDRPNEKVFVKRLGPAVITKVDSGDNIIVDLPRDIPIGDWRYNFYLKAFTKYVPAMELSIVLPATNYYFVQKVDFKTRAPKLLIKFINQNNWKDLLSKYNIEGIYLKYTLLNPKSHDFANIEYDACKIGGKEIYTGDWIEKRGID
jgi:hypothetical protein